MRSFALRAPPTPQYDLYEQTFTHEFAQFAADDIVGAKIGEIVAHEDVHPPSAADPLGNAISDGSELPSHDTNIRPVNLNNASRNISTPVTPFFPPWRCCR